MKKTIIIIGAGPAGLTCGKILGERGHKVTIYEADKEYVGGLSKTVQHNNFRIDIGGHRFYSKENEIRNFWEEILKNNLLRRKRISRILYRKIFLSYPIKIKELLVKLSPKENFLFFSSYCESKICPPKRLDTFEKWVTAHFGRRLFEAFFKSYTEKVWGRKCSEISSDWAEQRINNLDILTLLKNSISSFFFKKTRVKTLISEFDYPKLGPGMLWEMVRDQVLQNEGEIFLGKKIVALHQAADSKKWIVETDQGEKSVQADEIISTLPLPQLILAMNKNVPENIQLASKDFSHRSFITVAIMFKGQNSFPDNWIYIQDTRVKVARIQNYGNWSESMVPGPAYACYGLEYFCQKDDEFWRQSEHELFVFALEELRILGISFSSEELDFKVIKSEFAYPVYDMNYKERLVLIQNFLDRFPTIHPVGRSGLHRYNNQDHSIKTAMLACENIELGYRKFNPWHVNQDAAYLEKIED